MKAIVIPGYGDRRDYIDWAQRWFAQCFHLDERVHVFGWNGRASSYGDKWQHFADSLNKEGKVTLIGISAGASVALRALADFPDKIAAVVTICGPSRLSDLNPETVKKKYPVFGKSLARVDLSKIDTSRILTLRPLFDGVVSPRADVIPGATNKRMHTFGHAYSIVWALFFRQRTIAKFIRSKT